MRDFIEFRKSAKVIRLQSPSSTDVSKFDVVTHRITYGEQQSIIAHVVDGPCGQTMTARIGPDSYIDYSIEDRADFERALFNAQ